MDTYIFSKVARLVTLCCFLTPPVIFSQQAWAYSQGEILSDVPGGYHYDIPLDTVDISSGSNGAGDPIKDSTWHISSVGYTVNIYCSSPINQVSRFYTATTTMMPSEINQGYMKLNEYIDVKVQIKMISGMAGAFNYVAVPFYNRPNNVPESCTPPKTTIIRDTQSGADGIVSFKVRKPIINGINLQGTELVKLYGRLGSAPGTSNPMATVSITSGIMTVPDKCVVNGGAPLVVTFDDIPSSSTLINSNKYNKKFNVHIKCEGGSFATGEFNIKVGVQPSGSGLASFNSDYLGTTGAGVDRSNLGVAIWNKAGAPVIPNHFYDMDKFSNNQGDWSLSASPIAKPGSEIPEGDYDASASIVAEFQ